MHGNEQHVSKLQKKSKNIIIKKDNATLYQKQTRKKQKNKNKNKQTNKQKPKNKNQKQTKNQKYLNFSFVKFNTNILFV